MVVVFDCFLYVILGCMLLVIYYVYTVGGCVMSLTCELLVVVDCLEVLTQGV